MKKLVLVSLTMTMLSGCAISLGPEFSTKAKEDLGMSPIIYYRADWINGVYGYPSFAEALASKIQIMRGALVVDDEKVAFVRFDKQIQKYDYILELKYSALTDVRVFRKGLGRRLAFKTGNSIYTFEIVKGGVIDRAQTYKFAVFIADKLGKDSSEFSKELAEEKGRGETEAKESLTKQPGDTGWEGNRHDEEIFLSTNNLSTRYYHRSDCKVFLSEVKETGRTKLSREQAEARGLEPCPICKP